MTGGAGAGTGLDGYSVQRATQTALAAGISVIPVAEDGTKSPAISWKSYQAALPTADDVHSWFGDNQRLGLGVICGAVSGGLEMLELESQEAVDEFWQTAAATGVEPLLQRVARGYSELAPRGGLHLLYRCSDIEGNKKLANAKTDEGFVVKIETRGEGGYVITAPSHGTVHPTGKPYQLVAGGFDKIATVTPGERAALFALARSLDEKPRPEVLAPVRTERIPGYDRPGDIYNDTAEWADILVPHGWQPAGLVGEAMHWTRPGKLRGSVSATTNYRGNNRLHVFTTSTQFEAERGYTPFSAYCLLNHDGDYAAAAAALADQGYRDISESDPVAASLRNFDEDDVATSPSAWPPIIQMEKTDLPPFPTDALPPVLREMTECLASASETPPDLAALMTLAVVAACVAGKVVVQPKEGWSEHLNLYIAVAMLPGSRKSSVVAAAIRPLQEVERAAVAHTLPAVAEAEEILRLHTAIAEKASKDATKANDPTAIERAKQAAREVADIEVPVVPQLLAGDVTPEALADRMAEQGGRMAIIQAEGGLFDTLAGRYSRGVPNLDVVLLGFNGEPLRIDRMSRSCFIPRPTLTLALAIQPHILQEVLKPEAPFTGRGLSARILWSLPTDTVGSRTGDTAPVPLRVEAEYTGLVTRLAGLPEVPPDQELPKITLSAEAVAMLHSFSYGAEGVEPRLGPTGDLYSAGLMHLVRYSGGSSAALTGAIAAEDMAAALSLAPYFIEHARAAMNYVDRADGEVAEILLSWMRRKALLSFTTREAFQALKGRVKIDRVDDLEGALRQLCDRKIVKLHEAADDPVKRPGRPASPRWEVNPLALRS